ncbi:glycosyltransferase family 1 protein [Georgenia yuyongxinii]|uniref:Glycosyltransferase family 1 protein n=1 Tax=Georgenia yuyongxinii TaxID=2589797 RepID=A0A5B8C596_9MICO|nr:glycosyltransferase [Georgenia yuyongxinii]QDC25518.1 glycosyltransferase family 1 protein [Georgenia yuyongxinii]
MRALVTFAGGTGHYGPLAPIARALSDAGHEVRVACQASAAPVVAADGFDVVATSAETARPVRLTELLPLDPDREDRALREAYAGSVARSRARELLALGQTWRPDVVVCDEVDFGAMVAAERLGVPHATVLVMAAGSFVREEVIGEPLRRLRAEHGLRDEPGLAMPARHLVLCPFPPSFRDPAFPLPATARLLRPAGVGVGGHGVADGVPSSTGDAAHPLVYFSLGTVFNLESGDLFARVVTGLRDLPADVLVSLGADLEAAVVGPQPDHVRVETYVDQAAVVARAAVVVTHGGSGTVSAALAAGVPLVVLPMGADQPHNAARCTDLGVGLVLDPVTVPPAQVRDAVGAMLTDPGYRRRAQGVAAEAATLPAPAVAVGWLEDLAIR